MKQQKEICINYSECRLAYFH